MKKNYSKHKPLVSFHIPKCGGTSLYNIFKYISDNTEFNLIRYYPDIGENLPPDFYKIESLIIHGHFTRWKNHGIENIFPDASQYVTVVRNPIDTLLSGYFYGLNKNEKWATENNLETFIEWHVENNISPLFSSLPLLDYENVEEYVDNFLLIGLSDKLDIFYDRLSELLGFELPFIPSHENSSYNYSKKISKELIHRLSIKYEKEINLVNYLNGSSHW